MELKDLEIFYRAAEAQSFLHSGVSLSPSAIGRKISKLEGALGVKLFYRHQNSVSLTDEGLLFYERAKNIIAEVEASQSDFDREDDFSGKVILYAPTAWNNIFLTKYCKAFLEKYPEASLEVFGTDEMPKFDAITPQVGIYYSLPESKDLSYECVASYNLGLYASKKYIERYGAPKTLADLDNHKLLAYSAAAHGGTKFLWHLDVGMTAGERRHAYFYLNNVIPALQEGMGIATINEEHPVLEGGDIVRVLPEIKGPEIQIYFINHKLQNKTKGVRFFKEVLKENMPA